ncbi:unnamed protein product [Fusarium fujikuroi]|uniref:Uncharacterized protein n=1 Tax=Fusarium fujikuroi TaxID=5127 RepID=A0A9Q9RTM8_FUSFU|nr:unnamed protein product [Fusarium fujikuroi]VTT78565.1 unnamed protein product [Fusarium fujikuroi]VZI02209.1 unnamed protein product [Fusarium fujikuroi]
MSSQASSSKEVVAPNPQPPPKPPEELPKELQGGKFIFFTLDTLFNRDYAIECALKKCRDLNQDLQSKSMDELKRAYRGAMDEAYRQHIQTQLHGPGLQHNNNPQVPMDKVGLMFQQLNLELPSASERKRIGNEFAVEFNRNRFEATGASHLLKQLKRLDYSIVVADHSFDWDIVNHLNFWHDVGAMILTEDLLVRKPDPRVFQKALDGCEVSAKTALVVGCSVEEDILGILAAGAEPILYMPGHNYMTMDVQGTRVLVVRTMAELSLEIHLRPENSQLVPAQHNQPPPRPQHPVHPPMVYAPQNQENPSDQNAAPSSARQRLPSMRLHPPTEDYGTSSVNPAHRSSPSPSTQNYGPRAPTPATEVPTPNGQGSRSVSPDSNSPVHSSGGSTPRGWLPSMRLYPLTEDYGISIGNHNGDRDQPRSRHDGPDIHLHLHLDLRIDHPPRKTPGIKIWQGLGKADMGTGPRGAGTPPKAEMHLHLHLDLRIDHPPQATLSIKIRHALGKKDGGYPPGPSAQRQSIAPELRDVAQSSLDLARDIGPTDSSSKDVDEQTGDMAGRQ